MRWMRASAPPVPTMPPPRDIECLEMVSQALEAGVRSALEAYSTTNQVMVAELGLAYGAVWLPDDHGAFSVRVEHGELVDTLRGRRAAEAALLLDDVAPARLPISNRAIAVDESSPAPLAERWRAAGEAGVRAGAVIPIVQGGAVVAVQEFYSFVELPFFGGRGRKWEAIGRLLENARRAALTTFELNETLADRRAVTVVVGRVGGATDERAALVTALEDIRSSFGWTWASFWELDESAGVLRLARDSGLVPEDFRRAMASTSYAEGVGLAGRAWRTRDLVCVPDLGELTDEVRSPEIRRAGLHAAVCLPIVVDGRLLGAMEFLGSEVGELSDSRSTAMRSVQQLVCQRLDTLRRAEADATSARELLETVDALRESALSAGEVAAEAVACASAMTRDVRALSVASAEIGDVIKIISRIAGQTNLLSLNATIEAARAGAAGRGFGVVAAEVKDLARETASATQKVADQIAGIQASSGSVSAGIEATSDIIGQLDTVQARIMRVLDRQAAMAGAFDQS